MAMNIASMVSRCVLCGQSVSCVSLDSPEGIVKSHDFDAAMQNHYDNECPAMAAIRSGEATLPPDAPLVDQTNLTLQEGYERQLEELRTKFEQLNEDASPKSSTGKSVSSRRAVFKRASNKRGKAK